MWIIYHKIQIWLTFYKLQLVQTSLVHPNKITCYCCQEQITKISNLSIHIRNTIIIFEIYVLQLIFRERDISTILYTSYQMHSCFLANHKRNLRIKTPSSIFAYNNFIHIRCGKYFFNYSDI